MVRMQRGSTAWIFLAVFGILVVTMWGGYHIFKVEPDNAPLAPSELVTVQEDSGKVRKTRSFVVLDNSFAYSAGKVYYRSGTAQDGEPLYSILPVKDPESFSKVGSASAPAGTAHTSYISGSGGPSTYAQSAYASQSAEPVTSGQSTSPQEPLNAGGSTQLGSAYGTGSPEYSVSYYTDGENVYMIIESGGTTSEPQVVIGADPDTFEVLNAEYAKDDTHVYVVIVTCVGGSCSASVSIVASADPDTFQAFPNAQNVYNSDCTGYVVADSQDANHVYNNGQVVDGVSVYLIGEGGSCDDTPVLISP